MRKIFVESVSQEASLQRSIRVEFEILVAVRGRFGLKRIWLRPDEALDLIRKLRKSLNVSDDSYPHFARPSGLDELNVYSKLGYEFVAVMPDGSFLVMKDCTDEEHEQNEAEIPEWS